MQTRNAKEEEAKHEGELKRVMTPLGDLKVDVIFRMNLEILNLPQDLVRLRDHFRQAVRNKSSFLEEKGTSKLQLSCRVAFSTIGSWIMI